MTTIDLRIERGRRSCASFRITHSQVETLPFDHLFPEPR